MEDKKAVVPVEPGLSISKVVEVRCLLFADTIVRGWSSLLSIVGKELKKGLGMSRREGKWFGR
jgi:hypothetical protein